MPIVLGVQKPGYRTASASRNLHIPHPNIYMLGFLVKHTRVFVVCSLPLCREEETKHVQRVQLSVAENSAATPYLAPVTKTGS